MPRRGRRPLGLMLLTGAGASMLSWRRRPVAGAVNVRQPDSDEEAQGDSAVEEMRPPGPSRVYRSLVYLALVAVLVGAGAIYAGYEIKFTREARARAIQLTAGDPDLGRMLARRHGCAGCHTIPGVPGSKGQVGPDLSTVAGRVYLGGVITNTPDNMIEWIMNPRAIDPKSAMPVTGISRTEARHVAAYLYTLR